MARPSVKDKLPDVKARRVWEWKPQLLRETKAAAPHLEGIMNGLLFGKEKAEEADLVFRHLFLECGNNEKAAFRILIACADAIYKDEKAFPPSPPLKHKSPSMLLGRPTREVVEFFRPLEGETIWGEKFEMPNDANDPWKPHPFMRSVLARYVNTTGRRGRTRDLSDGKISFIVVMTIRLRDKKGNVLKSLFDRLYKFTFGKTIHLPDYRDTIRWAEEGLAARLSREKDPPPPEK